MNTGVKYKCVKCGWTGYRRSIIPCYKCGGDMQRVAIRKLLTPDEEKFIIDNYKKMIYSDIAKALGRSESIIGNFLHRKKLKLPKSEHNKRHKAWLFKKGSISWNKGIKLSIGANITSFQKGHKPANTKPEGTVSARYHNRDKCIYLYIKISDRNWELLSRYNWEKAYGPIPKKHVIRFKDKDTTNCNIENLELVSMRDNLLRNAPEVRPDSILFDRYVAARLKIKGKENQDYFIKEHPELIELKRQQLLLQRGINETRRAS